jgi:hypothetical protein
MLFVSAMLRTENADFERIFGRISRMYAHQDRGSKHSFSGSQRVLLMSCSPRGHEQMGPSGELWHLNWHPARSALHKSIFMVKQDNNINKFNLFAS